MLSLPKHQLLSIAKLAANFSLLSLMYYWYILLLDMKYFLKESIYKKHTALAVLYFDSS